MTKKEIIKTYENACNLLACSVNKCLFDDSRSWYWVDNEIGGICDFGDTDFLTSEEMKLILQSDMTYEEYKEWRESNIKYAESKGVIDLYPWLLGRRHKMLKGKTDWISVEDELPPYEEDVLVCDQTSPEEMWFCHRSSNPDVLNDKNGFCYCMPEYNVTHWQRIEQLPKE